MRSATEDSRRFQEPQTRVPSLPFSSVIDLRRPPVFADQPNIDDQSTFSGSSKTPRTIYYGCVFFSCSVYVSRPGTLPIRPHETPLRIPIQSTSLDEGPRDPYPGLCSRASWRGNIPANPRRGGEHQPTGPVARWLGLLEDTWKKLGKARKNLERNTLFKTCSFLVAGFLVVLDFLNQVSIPPDHVRHSSEGLPRVQHGDEVHADPR